MKGTGVFLGPRCSHGPSKMQSPVVPGQQTSMMTASGETQEASDAGSSTDSCCSTPAAAGRPRSVPLCGTSTCGACVESPGSPSRRSTFPGGQQLGLPPHAAVTARHSFDQSWVGTRGNRRNLGRSSPLPALLQHPPPPPRTQQYDGAMLLSHNARGTASNTAHQPALSSGRRTAFSGPLPSPTATGLPQPAATGGADADAAKAAAQQQLLAGSSGQHRWAIVAPADTSDSSSSSLLRKTLLQLRARLAAAREVAGAATAGTHAAAALSAAAGSARSGMLTGNGPLLLAPVAGAGGSMTRPFGALQCATSAGTPSTDIAALLQQEQQQQQQQQQVMLVDEQVPDIWGCGGGVPSSSPTMAAPFASASLLLPGVSCPALHNASINALSVPVGLPTGLSVPALPAHVADGSMAVADGCIDLAALAAGAVQQKLAEMEQIEARHRQLYEEVLTLLPLV